MGDVEALCKRVIIINHGKILFNGELSDLIKKHAPYKLISIVLTDMINPQKLEGLGEIKKFVYPELIISAPVNDASEIAAKILKSLPIEDVNIEDPDVEDIIRNVFQQKT